MEYTIFGRAEGIHFAAAGVEEVLQNVRTILCTKKFSVPLDRGFGLDYNVLDRPLPKAQSGLRVEVIEAVRRFEPRAKVLRVEFNAGPGEAFGAGEGILIPKVTVSVNV